MTIQEWHQNSTFWIQTQVAQVSGISCWLWNPIYCCPLCSRLWSHLWLAHCVSQLGRIPWQEDSCLSLQEVWTWDPKGERTVPSTAGRTRKRSMFIAMPRTGTYTILYLCCQRTHLFVKHLLHRGRYSICGIHFVSIDRYSAAYCHGSWQHTKNRVSSHGTMAVKLEVYSATSSMFDVQALFPFHQISFQGTAWTFSFD